MFNSTRDLRRQLRKEVIDHVSDLFQQMTPLLDLIKAAKSGKEKELDEQLDIFNKYDHQLQEVANLVCIMSKNGDATSMVRHAQDEIEIVCYLVKNAATILAHRPNSGAAQRNMEAYRLWWEDELRLFTKAVNEITAKDDFLAVSENSNVCEAPIHTLLL